MSTWREPMLSETPEPALVPTDRSVHLVSTGFQGDFPMLYKCINCLGHSARNGCWLCKLIGHAEDAPGLKFKGYVPPQCSSERRAAMLHALIRRHAACVSSALISTHAVPS